MTVMGNADKQKYRVKKGGSLLFRPVLKRKEYKKYGQLNPSYLST